MYKHSLSSGIATWFSAFVIAITWVTIAIIFQNLLSCIVAVIFFIGEMVNFYFIFKDSDKQILFLDAQVKALQSENARLQIVVDELKK